MILLNEREVRMYWEQQSERLWQLVDPGNGFVPYKVFGFHEYVHRVKPYAPPEGYEATHKHWFSVWDEASGVYELSVFYPKEASNGDGIRVVVDCSFCGITTRAWTHGDRDLAYDIASDGHLEGLCTANPVNHTAPSGTADELLEFYSDLVPAMVAYGSDADDIALAIELRDEAAEACKKRIQGDTVAGRA